MFFKKINKKFISYRNIATCNPTQNIFDDIASSKDFSKLQRHENASSGIDHAKAKQHRSFQYGDTRISIYVFEKLNWRRGRFSDGTTYGVWYGALEEKTSRLEILYHFLKDDEEQFQNPKITDDYIVHQRSMLQADCCGENMVDLTTDHSMYAQLTENDYSFCRQLAREAINDNVEGFFTPSPRNKGGLCTPIFNPSVIKQDGFVYYFDFIIYRNGKIEYKRTDIQQITIPQDW